MRFHSLALAVTSSLTFAFPGAAAETEVFKTVGEWTVIAETGDASRCYASRMMEDKTEVQVGLNLNQENGFFAIYNPAWTDIEDGAVGYIEFNFGTSRFGGDAVGKIENGVQGGYAVFDNPAFVKEFANGQSVKITGSKGATFDMNLTGTKNAVSGVLECQKAKAGDAAKN
ncbi:MAG: hypothetical protein ACSHXD_05435 [Marinosulfonomonas sp.]